MANEAAKPQLETTAQQWQRIRELLADAVELPQDRRSAYLDGVCAGDSQLRARLDELLAAHDATHAGSLDQPAFSFTRSLQDSREASPSVIGRRIGAYRIEAEIAHGGMGAVFRAVRADDQYSKQVAIKLVSGAAFSSQVTEMFRRERQVLASLEHPNIARLLDGGAMEDGSPFLVMEYVEGEPVTRYCESHQLGVDDRLRLFQKICSAVQYAHQNLVIHRDIKPANILVTEEGEPKLLDFGIAKFVDLDPGANVTATAWQALTPAYASPEQLCGEPVTTATDVYSLGVVLYELLTGMNPFSSRQSSSLRLQRAILEEHPELPSRAAVRDQGPNREDLGNRLKGDVDSIVGKAIRKQRTERYSSVEQFADDVRRHLENLPVLAQPDTWPYRAAKFARRHRTGMLASALILASLVTGMVLAAYEARIARAERLRAERRFSDVRKLANSLLFDLHDAIQDLPGSTPARKMIVEKSLQYLDSLSTEGGGDPGLLRELATAYERVGELQGQYLADNLGETSNSFASYRKALGIRRQLGEDRNAPWQDRLSLAESYRRMASQVQAMRQTREALAQLQKATEISEEVARLRPMDLKVLNELAIDYQVLATAQEQSWFGGWDQLTVSVETDKKAIAVANKMVNLDPTNLEAERRLGNNTLQIANAQSDLDDFSDAVQSFNQALGIFRSVAQRSGAVKDRRRVAVVLNQLGQLYDREGNWRLTLENHEKGLGIYKQLFKEDPKNVLLRQGLGIAFVNTGEGKSKLGRLSEGRADINQGIAIMRAGMTDPNEEQRNVLAQMYMILGDNLARGRQPYQSLRQYKAAAQIYDAMPADPDNNGLGGLSVATCEVGIAKAQLLTGQPEAAVTGFQKVLVLTASWVKRGNRGESNRDALRDAAQAYAGLAEVEAGKARNSPPSEQQRHWEQAIAGYRQSLEIGKQIPSFAQLDVMGFRASDVAKQLQQAKSEMSKRERRVIRQE